MICLKCALVGIASGTLATILTLLGCVLLLLLLSRWLGLDGLSSFGFGADSLIWLVGSFVLVWLIGFALGFMFTWRYLTAAA